MTSNANLETLCRQLIKIEIILLLPTVSESDDMEDNNDHNE
jgi:hypothetical protein